jgi:hypothetical protein
LNFGHELRFFGYMFDVCKADDYVEAVCVRGYMERRPGLVTQALGSVRRRSVADGVVIGVDPHNSTGDAGDEKTAVAFAASNVKHITLLAELQRKQIAVNVLQFEFSSESGNESLTCQRGSLPSETARPAERGRGGILGCRTVPQQARGLKDAP